MFPLSLFLPVRGPSRNSSFELMHAETSWAAPLLPWFFVGMFLINSGHFGHFPPIRRYCILWRDGAFIWPVVPLYKLECPPRHATDRAVPSVSVHFPKIPLSARFLRVPPSCDFLEFLRPPLNSFPFFVVFFLRLRRRVFFRDGAAFGTAFVSIDFLEVLDRISPGGLVPV